MRMLDASSIIYAWDNYPPQQFPTLWMWMGGLMRIGHLQISTIAFKEVDVKSNDCTAWMKLQPINQIAISNTILTTASHLQKSLNIVNGKYSNGVGENDLLIISTARIHGATLISNEAVQTKLPTVPANCKIPAVCAHHAGIKCINFLDFIKESATVF